MTENTKTELTELAIYLHEQKEDIIKKTESKEDMFELICYKIINYCVKG